MVKEQWYKNWKTEVSGQAVKASGDEKHRLGSDPDGYPKK